MDDWELIRAYANSGSEEAFTTLVQRHVNLVFSTAVRQVGDAHSAQEVSQAVFSLLAEKARSLDPKTSLTGWLYRTTCFKSVAHRRTKHRRVAHEQEAARMNSSVNAPEPASDANWNQFALLLDDAMQELPESDRLAILLRYFQNQPLREVGVALGLEEDAARKRVSRALDKLRDWFSAKGVVSTSIGLAGILSANAVQAAPAGVVELFIKTALITGAVAAGGSAVSTTTFMASTKIAIATAAVVTAVLTFPLLSQWQQKARIQNDLNAARTELAQLKLTSASTNEAVIPGEELARLKANQSELLRLRGEVGRLRLESKEIEKLKQDNERLLAVLTRPGRLTEMITTNSDPSALFTRTYKIDPDIYAQNIKRLVTIPEGETASEILRRFMTNNGVDLSPPANVFFNDRNATLLIRNTSTEFEKINQLIELLSPTQ